MERAEAHSVRRVVTTTPPIAAGHRRQERVTKSTRAFRPRPSQCRRRTRLDAIVVDGAVSQRIQAPGRQEARVRLVLFEAATGGGTLPGVLTERGVVSI